MRTLGQRSVDVAERTVGGREVFAAQWTEPDGVVITIDTVGLSWSEVEASINAMRSVDDAEFGRLHPVALPASCVDADRLLAPTWAPPDLQRFVLSMRPLGSCGDAPLLTVSFAAPGRLITITSSPVGTSWDDGPVENWDGRAVTVVSTPDQRASRQVSFVDHEVLVRISATGITDEELHHAVAAVQPVDAAGWQQLIDAVVVEPSHT